MNSRDAQKKTNKSHKVFVTHVTLFFFVAPTPPVGQLVRFDRVYFRSKHHRDEEFYTKISFFFSARTFCFFALSTVVFQKSYCQHLISYACRYLHSKGVDFTRRNNGGNDPLNHAVAYGRRDIAAWLLEEGQTAASAPLRDENQTGELGDGDAHGVTETKAGRRRRRRRDDPQLLDLARLTGDEKMQAFLLEGRK